MFRASSCPSSGSYQPDRPRPTTLLPPRSNGKPEAATAVDKLLTMGMRMPKTCWAVFKRHAIKLRDWCIWLVDLFEWLCLSPLLVVKTAKIIAKWPNHTFWSKISFVHTTGRTCIFALIIWRDTKGTLDTQPNRTLWFRFCNSVHHHTFK